MGRKIIEMVGKRFERLIVVGESGRDKHGNALWKCLCNCGNIKIIIGKSLRRGITKSCGCLNIEKATKHGLCKTTVYNSWLAMIARCNNPNNKNYKYYGGRGITICDRWVNFENFFEDMGDRPDALTLERKNNNLGYSKENCKWATKTEQARNRRIFKNNKTGCRGIYWHKRDKKYQVDIKSNNKRIHIGSYDSLKQAATERKKAEQKYWGQQNEDTQ